jgi:hypothetical protein
MKAHICVAALLLLVISQPMLADEPLSKSEMTKLGKAATVFIDLPESRTTGSGFCINSAGLFLTNAHVVAPGGQVNIVVGSGTLAQKKYPAALVRVDKEHDLALLRVTSDDTFTALPLGSDDKLAELQEVIAFGFPFGAKLSLNERDYPTISINSGAITALRFQDQKLDKIQLDAAVNPGNSGGPVLDRTGKVIGVVVSGLKGSGINFAIPISQVQQFVSRPVIVFTPPPITTTNLREPVTFSAQILSMLPEAKPLTVELSLTNADADGGERTLKLKQVKDRFIVVTEAVHPPAGPVQLSLRTDFGMGTVTGLVNDRPIRVGSREVLLSEIVRIEHKPKPQVVLVGGQSLPGEPIGLDALEVKVGDQVFPCNLLDAREFSIAKPDPPMRIPYVLSVIQDGNEVARRSAEIVVADSAVVAKDPRSVLRGARIVHLQEYITRVDLPAMGIVNVVEAAGGNYLILRLNKPNKLVVFDVKACGLVGSIELDSRKVLFTAGASKLMLLDQMSGILERWSLPGLVKEASTTLQLAVPIAAMAMGSNSEGPLIISGSNNSVLSETALFDIGGMRRIENGYDKHNCFETSPDVRLSVSANGKLFFCQASRRSNLQLGTWDGERLIKSDGPVLTNALPGPDGRFVYGDQGRYSVGSKRLDETIKNCLPAQRGPYFVALSSAENSLSAAIYREGIEAPLTSLNPIELNLEMFGDRLFARSLGNDHRVHFMRDARVLVVIPRIGSKLFLYALDMP